ncbi:dTDP-4-dehydrorhamnose 3,5-epimerase [Adhaeribacter aquaticus]|uniref:dTDP-4-dehydrorhamnose 3,5-epimerase n=1 Tax=Adhaeribacter aquaticus TaxID=299567 RepID=UPI0003FEC847|nr:dTDP-4-dehydrorhamnose 3,5-epimerase [Adhaeribacter aquaticus]
MEFKRYPIEGIIEIIPRKFGDPRGYFFESYSQKVFAEAGIDVTFVQDNESFSQKGVLRGLHFQKPPYAQGKLVRVSRGSALDVAVDIRKDSPTYGQHVTCLLNTEQNNMFYVPEGFAHGFVALEDNTTFLYKCTNYYHPASEGGIIWNDPALGINWNITDPLVSAKDQILPTLAKLNSPF